MRQRLLGALLVLPLAFTAHALDDLRVLPDDAGTMMHNYLNGLAETALAERREKFEAIDSLDTLSEWQEDRRDYFIDQLGGFPDCNPLNARVVDSKDYEDFRLEKIIFESRPNFFVTGVLYLPLTEGPHPAVLVPCGHSANGKASEAYQRVCILLAKHGMAAFCYDPIGQGERYQVLDENGKPRFGATTEHTFVGIGSILLGTNTAGYRVWDGIRAIDYLSEREDIDADNLGITGNSGGGTLTSYLMALDMRLKVAAPSCYLTSFDALLDTIGPQDAEQNIFGQLEFGLDHADYIIMRAPRPTLVCAATHDFFDIEGTWDSYREAKRVYTMFGYPERLGIAEANEEHGFSIRLREAAVQWLQRWLRGIDKPVTETGFEVLHDEALQVTPEGQVLLLEGAQSVFDINRELDLRLQAHRLALWRREPPRRILPAVRRAVVMERADANFAGEYEVLSERQEAGYTLSKVVLRPEAGVTLPALALRPGNASGITYVAAYGDGFAAHADQLDQWAKKGHAVLAVDLRGMGETAPPPTGNNSFDKSFGNGWRDFFVAYLLGKSYVGMRADDVTTAARFAEHFYPAHAARQVFLVATGAATVPALHAAAVAPDRFDKVRLENGLVSWSTMLVDPLQPNMLEHVVHGALQLYDVADLVRLLPDDVLVLDKRAESD